MDEEWLKVIKSVAPGTALREALDNILRARTGALLVFGDTRAIQGLVDGGISINADFSPPLLYELAKMDGAIILDSEGKKILHANAQLVPDAGIPSFETGIRHRTAERFARQTEQMVIAISQRRNTITLYKGSRKYMVRDIAYVLAKANHAIQTLEKYKSAFDDALAYLTMLELGGVVTLRDVALVLRRIEMTVAIISEIVFYATELGTEGRFVGTGMEQMGILMRRERYLLLKDYHASGEEERIHEAERLLETKKDEEMLSDQEIVKILGHGAAPPETEVAPRGYRLLGQIPKIPTAVIDSLVKEFGSLSNIVQASIDELDRVTGVGEARAKAIQEGLRRMKERCRPKSESR
ncbi:MAG TPA: DNA integrity scanning protein DisA [Clostridia bacterium]|nr:DNA integrity scanning protein DisA [Clostridia bacterium]